ncbi:MAG: T9SS type A sorting domain-containing protein, partial [Bacteroidales bacterium]|nr:T9SS type A sorting domain-containing protein [Bacteroidales bacterium]
IGNCHEDALLVAAAARTALIPLMHIGDFCDDHVWGMMHDGGDSIWHHFEFFRGGCSPNRPYYWGMTNMQPTGNYGWASSLVQGYVPDGTLFNVSDYYSKQTPACNLEMTITDADGKAVDGARINLYSTNYQYSSTSPYIMSAGYLWSDANGKVYAKVGSGNKYYMKITHPKYGSFPEESGKVYVVIKDNTVAGRNYKINYQFTGKAQRDNVGSRQERFESDKGLRLNLDVRNVTYGENPVDGQRSTFYQRTGSHASVNVYLMTAEQLATKDSALYRFDGLSKGTFDFPMPKDGKAYLVVTNDRNLTNSVELSYSASSVGSGSFDIVPVPQYAAEKKVRLYPNPATERLHVEAEGFRQARIFSMDGRCLKVVRTNDISLEGLAAGLYLLQVEHRDGAVVVKKFVKE